MTRTSAPPRLPSHVVAILSILLLLAWNFTALATSRKVETLLNQGKVEEAIAELEREIERHPMDIGNYMEMADIYRDYTAVRDPNLEHRYVASALAIAKAGLDREAVRRLETRLASTGTAKDDTDFVDAQRSSTVAAYETYLALHPSGKHRSEARHAIEDLVAEAALAEGTERAYRTYIESENGRSYHDRQRVVLDLHRVAAQEAEQENTESRYLKYLARYPKSAHVADMERLLHRCVVGGDGVAGHVRYVQRHHAREGAANDRYVVQSYDAILQGVEPGEPEALAEYIESWPSATNLDRAHSMLYDFHVAQQTEAAMLAYVSTYPGYPHVMSAWEHVFEAYYDKSDAKSMSRFLTHYPDSPLFERAQSTLWSVTYEKAVEVRTVSALQAWIAKYPDAPQVSRAANEIRGIRDERCGKHAAYWSDSSKGCACRSGFYRDDGVDPWRCKITREELARREREHQRREAQRRCESSCSALYGNCSAQCAGLGPAAKYDCDGSCGWAYTECLDSCE